MYLHPGFMDDPCWKQTDRKKHMHNLSLPSTQALKGMHSLYIEFALPSTELQNTGNVLL